MSWEATYPETVRQWVINHDESWLFVGAYVVLAVVLSLYSLFWLVVVVGVHFVLELVRQAHVFDGWGQTVGEALWEVKLDIGLVVFALALTLYLPFVFGVLGLSSATRAAAGANAVARSGGRMVRLKNATRAILLSLDDVGLLAKGLIGGKVANETWSSHPEEDDAVRDRTSWTEPWGLAAWGSLAFTVISALLLVGAPFITGYSFEGVATVVMSEMEPFP